MRVSYVVLAGMMICAGAVPSHALDLLNIGGGANADASVNIGGSSDASDGAGVEVGAGAGVEAGGTSSPDAGVGAAVGVDAGVSVGHDGSVDVGADVGAAADAGILGHTTMVAVGVRGGASIGLQIPGLPGGNGQPGMPPVSVKPGAGTPTTEASGTATAGAATAAGATIGPAGCDDATLGQMSTMMKETHVSPAWASAGTVQVERMDACSGLSEWVSDQLAQDGLTDALRAAVTDDADISSVLRKANYDADNVFAVHQVGNRVVVFVY